MKRYLFLCLFLLIGAASSYAQPKMQFVESYNLKGDTYDWGKVKPEDSPLHCKVVIKNIGDSALIITQVKPGCGCTTARPLSKDTIAPNDTASFEISLNIGSNSGAVSKSITISSNDYRHAPSFLILKAEVIRPLQTSSPYFSLPQSTVGEKVQSTMRMKNNTTNPMKITEVNCLPDKILTTNLKVGSTLAPGQEIEVTIYAVPDKAGQFQGSVNIKTDNPQVPQQSLTAYGPVKESPLYSPQN